MAKDNEAAQTDTPTPEPDDSLIKEQNETAVEPDEATKAEDNAAALAAEPPTEEPTSTYRESLERGYFGQKADPTPNEAYSVTGKAGGTADSSDKPSRKRS